jgi:prolyl-tRNA editing enzyme YbaK/EbsC (Cys-tRNA(Pro) deacylase)
MPVYVEHSVLSAPRIYVNGGSRGLILELASADLVRILNPRPVQVAIYP